MSEEEAQLNFLEVAYPFLDKKRISRENKDKPEHDRFYAQCSAEKEKRLEEEARRADESASEEEIK